MQFNLKSKITNHSIDLSNLAERVVVGPQEEVLRKIESFNIMFHADIRCTKRFRWEPGLSNQLVSRNAFTHLARNPTVGNFFR